MSVAQIHLMKVKDMMVQQAVEERRVQDGYNKII